jgi:hypothetical protein
MTDRDEIPQISYNNSSHGGLTMTREQMIATAESFVDFDAGRYWERGVEKPMPAHYLPFVRTPYIATKGVTFPSAQAEHRRR